jgi:two-component system sensor histidine kinase DesK
VPQTQPTTPGDHNPALCEGADGDERGELIGVLVGMAWLAIPIIDTIGGDPAPWRAALAAVLFAVAVGAYLVGMSCEVGMTAPPPLVLRCMAAIAACGIVLTLLVSGSWAILFTYLAVLSGLHLPPRSAGIVLIGSTALAFGLSLPNGLAAALSWGVSALGIGALMLALGRLIHTNMALQAANERIEQLAVEAERERFARDLHDLLGHSLSVITLKAELAGRLLPARPGEAQRHVRELEEVARAALGEMRETVSGYRRPTLAGELAGARLALDAAGIELRVEQRAPELPGEVEALLAWTVREGTTNVIRHSGARRCEIAIAPAEDDGGAATAEVRDDGRGVPSGAPGGPGNGLEGLRERAAQLAGRVDAGAAAEGGFRLRVTVPAAGAETEAPE